MIPGQSPDFIRPTPDAAMQADRARWLRVAECRARIAALQQEGFRRVCDWLSAAGPSEGLGEIGKALDQRMMREAMCLDAAERMAPPPVLPAPLPWPKLPKKRRAWWRRAWKWARRKVIPNAPAKPLESL